MSYKDFCVLCRTPIGYAVPELPGYVTCQTCDLTWYAAQNPSDDSEEKNTYGDWEQDYYRDAKIFEFHKTRRSGFEAIVARLSEICPERGRLLDVGTGLGMLMETAAKDGWTVEGVEPSRSAADWAHRMTGSVVHHGFLEELKLKEQYYDAVTIVDVLRTVPNMLDFLLAAKRLLRPGGILLIREGNQKMLRRFSRSKEWLKGNATGQTAAAIRRGVSYYGFSPASLLRTLREVGLREGWVEPSPVFLDPAPGRNLMVPLVKRSAALASRAVYQASARRLVISPSLLAFGRAPLLNSLVLSTPADCAIDSAGGRAFTNRRN